ncbi:hypothetical protein MmiAt1_15400 [Methanimicrococcus sp. At1]|uniref:CcmD family protein n=1 Tax=Methanimicrococcus hacksteinii TaxID=3028293 RepID=A0ABU3VRA5_9EURY|nr:hypothetical protein [Methanimicrococcus sp. At1]MDV0445936.1 hypothetical protein [Methanimicrococcus sp. At1]
MNSKFILLLSAVFFVLFFGIAAAESENESLLIAFADDLSEADPEVYAVLLIFLIAVAVYIFYIWHDYDKDADFLNKKY